MAVVGTPSNAFSSAPALDMFWLRSSFSSDSSSESSVPCCHLPARDIDVALLEVCFHHFFWPPVKVHSFYLFGEEDLLGNMLVCYSYYMTDIPGLVFDHGGIDAIVVFAP